MLLWPDTFNDHFHPETLQAATRVLETAGFAVSIPKEPLCCGRPLYDVGMLDLAKARLRRIMAALETEIREGMLVVGLEPSCVSVFRDELVNLFPASEQAHRLQEQVVTLAELLDRHPERMPAARLERRALVHGHCHQQALVHMDADARVLTRAGVQHEVLDAGCCGMAGAFGFEREHYEVSMAAGERVLLPAVRGAPRDTLIVADGFSCREQIAQATDRRALHLADVLDMAIQRGPGGPAGDLPERDWVIDHAQARLDGWTLGAAGLASAVVAGAIVAGLTRRRVSGDD